MESPKCPNCDARLIRHCAKGDYTGCDWWVCPAYGGYGTLETDASGIPTNWVPDGQVLTLRRTRRNHY